MVSVKLVLDRVEGEAFAAQLPDDDPRTVVWTPERGNTLTVESYADSAAAARRIRGQWRKALKLLGLTAADAELTPVRDADWATDWRSHFHRERIDEHLVICPEWETYTPAPGEKVVWIDPGMSFGTGQHATTRACLRFLARLGKQQGTGWRFLDIGCGSGILAVAAALLGFTKVTAIDYDPIAVGDTARNGARNGVSGRIDCRQADLVDFHPESAYEVVAANLLADVLIAQAVRIVAALAPRGSLLVAGILQEQYPAVLAAYREHGFHEVDVAEEGDWRSGWLQGS